MIPETIWPLTVILVLWTLLTVYVYIRTPDRYYLRMALTPVSLIATFLMIQLVYFSLGYATSQPLPKEFELLGHSVVVKGGKKTNIEVWAAGTPNSRLFLIPYTKKTEEALEQARQAKKAGMRAMMKGKSGVPTGDMGDDYETNLLLPHQITPKAPLDTEQ